MKGVVFLMLTMTRSARVRPTCLQKVKFSLRRNGYIRQIDLAEALNLSQSTVSNFLNGKAVDYLNFLEICRVLNLEWKEIADLENEENLLPNSANVSEEGQISQTKSQVFIELRATLEDMDEPLLKALIVLLQERSADMSLTFQTIKTGSVVLVLKGSQSGCEQIETLFRQGQLTELLGIPVLSVRVESEAPVSDISPQEKLELLRQELENLFVANWQPVEWVLADNSRGSREINADALSGSVNRAKQIDLGSGQAVVVVQMIVESLEEVGIRVWVYPSGEAIHLPGGVQVSVLNEFGVIVPDLQIRSKRASDSLKLEFSVEPGERFSIRLALENISIQEDF